MERAKPNRNGKNEIRVTIPGIKMRTKKRPSTCNPVKTRKKTERTATMGSTQKIFFKIGAKSSVIKGQRNFGIRNTTPVLKKNHDRKTQCNPKPQPDCCKFKKSPGNSITRRKMFVRQKNLHPDFNSMIITSFKRSNLRKNTTPIQLNNDRIRDIEDLNIISPVDNQTIRREAPRANNNMFHSSSITKNWIKYSKSDDASKFRNFKNMSRFRILKKVKKSSSILKSSISKGKSVLKEDSTSKLLSSAQAQVEKNFKKLQKGSPTKNEQNKMAKTASNFRSSRSKPTQCKKNSRLYHIKTNNYMENTNIFKKALNQGNKICKNHTRLNQHYPSRLRHQNFVDEEDFLKNTRNQEKPLIIQNFIALEPSVKPQVELRTTQHSRLSKPVSKAHLLTKKLVEDCYQEFMRDLNEPEPDQTLFFKEIYKPA
ncbi:unnamed protein product [Moneuplotes crassus]|uniref:Uncharacterized protein n=1 Tax=Euplotes crassus TaxID=5936 RepID=A0AAD1U425_EUPCR|nr:unnamed protein product [Moneuplotes crassus]